MVFDPARRVGREPKYRLFNDPDARTLYFCASNLIAPGETQFGTADVVSIDTHDPRSDRSAAGAAVFAELRQRGCARIFVEGGGVTVSAFLQAGLLDRPDESRSRRADHLADGRPAIRLAPQQRLRDCRRPQYRVFRMGGDMLFDWIMTCTPEAPESDDQQSLRGSFLKESGIRIQVSGLGKVSGLRNQGGEIVMADHDHRAAGVDVGEAPLFPGLD